MGPDDLSLKVNDVIALAREDDELVRVEAEVLLEELAPGVVALIARVPSKRLRYSANVVQFQGTPCARVSKDMPSTRDSMGIR